MWCLLGDWICFHHTAEQKSIIEMFVSSHPAVTDVILDDFCFQFQDVRIVGEDCCCKACGWLWIASNYLFAIAELALFYAVVSSFCSVKDGIVFLYIVTLAISYICDIHEVLQPVTSLAYVTLALVTPTQKKVQHKLDFGCDELWTQLAGCQHHILPVVRVTATITNDECYTCRRSPLDRPMLILACLTGVTALWFSISILCELMTHVGRWGQWLSSTCPGRSPCEQLLGVYSRTSLRCRRTISLLVCLEDDCHLSFPALPATQ